MPHPPITASSLSATDPGRSNRIERRLAAYAAGAAAAVLVAPNDARADIVYTPGDFAAELFYPFQIDFNADGNPEFGVEYYPLVFGRCGGPFGIDCSAYTNARVYPIPGGAMRQHVEGADDNGAPRALQRGENIGPGASFEDTTARADILASVFYRDISGTMYDPGTETYGSRGNFLPDANPGQSPEQFVGVKFDINGQPFFGWIGIVTETTEPVGVGFRLRPVTITGFAYEDSGGSIAAGAVPEPHSLTLLAAGAAGVAAYRRKR